MALFCTDKVNFLSLSIVRSTVNLTVTNPSFTVGDQRLSVSDLLP